MNNINLGKLITENAQRDAIHIAIAPVIAFDPLLLPGQNIGFIDVEKRLVSYQASKYIGIADPFLKEIIKKDQEFYILLYPNTITSLRHAWTHPAFLTQPTSIIDAQFWINERAKEFGMDYDELMNAAKNFLENGDYILEESTETRRNYFYDICEEFWTKYELITGTKVEEKRQGIFSCAC